MAEFRFSYECVYTQNQHTQTNRLCYGDLTMAKYSRRDSMQIGVCGALRIDADSELLAFGTRPIEIVKGGQLIKDVLA